MPKAKYQNASKVPLLKIRPGQVFEIDVDDDGVPLEPYWAQRLDEERLFNVGAVIPYAPAAAPAEEPAVEPAPQPKSKKS